MSKIECETQAAISVDTRVVSDTTTGVQELYITVRGQDCDNVDNVGDIFSQARAFFIAVRDILDKRSGRIFQERFFATAEVLAQKDAISQLRCDIYGDRLADGVEPTWLVVDSGGVTAISGMQIHAVICDEPLKLITSNGVLCGRIYNTPDANRQIVSLNGLSSPDAGDNVSQTSDIFQQMDSILTDLGGSMKSVIRTWMWLGDILSWYDPFNVVRNDFFQDQCLIAPDGRGIHLPASTGIGIAPACGICAVDLIAEISKTPSDRSIKLLPAAGKQDSAFEYGSAFSRAAKMAAPAGTVVFISGTASIDDDGITTNLDDGPGQIRDTIKQIKAVLADTGCEINDVVTALIYCKTPEIEKEFLSKWADELSWPYITAITDVCRDNLLFEIELTACPGAKND